MINHAITIALVGLTGLAVVASYQAAAALSRRATQGRLMQAIIAGGVIVLFAVREFAVHQSWQPLASHLDGLLLLAAMLGVTTLLLEHPARLPGLSAFSLPMQAVLLLWAICASSFTLVLWEIDSIWLTVHLASVYVGAVFFAMAAGAGGMFLYRQRQLRRKEPMDGRSSMASLERIEKTLVRSAAMAFAMLTLTVAMGIVLATEQSEPVSTRVWLKIGVAGAVWCIYLVLMNVRRAAMFRGAAAAWLSIAAFVLVLAVFGIASSSDSGDEPPVTTAWEGR